MPLFKFETEHHLYCRRVLVAVEAPTETAAKARLAAGEYDDMQALEEPHVVFSLDRDKLKALR